MRRRSFFGTTGAGSVSVFLAGCTGTGGEQTTTEASGDVTEMATMTEGATAGGELRTLTAGTYGSFVNTPSSSPDPWLKEMFELKFDITLGWQTPDSGVSYYVECGLQGVESGADLYVGLDTQMFIRIDRELDETLFLSTEGPSRIDDVKEGLNFDPQGRVIPYDTGYIPLVYNEAYGDGDFVTSETLDGLLDSEYAGALPTQNPTSSATGQAFLLHTVDTKNEDSYLDYWASPKKNDVRVLGNWENTCSTCSNRETPMVTSYSTDQVSAAESGENMARHQIRFLDDQTYANPEGMTSLAGALNPDLAVEFVGFVLRPEVQTEIAARSVQFPTTTTAELPEDFVQYA